MGLFKLINEIEKELQLEYQGGAINYIDSKHNNAWSEELSLLDMAIKKFQEKQISFDDLKVYTEIYKTKCINWIMEFKKENEQKAIDLLIQTASNIRS